jgi:SAM-dependent methyltransferase
MVGAQPVLIDFAASIFERRMYDAESGSVLQRDVSRRSIGSRLHRLTFGGNPVAVSNSAKFIDLLKRESRRPVVLVVGGGTIGSGADELYHDDAIELVGTDVYASPHTVLVADAHRLPFEDGVFDGVWVQAVLEHVLEPATVVAELHRVLRPEGLVYAETPFMQQVHERAYDFSRFTQSGHRWLFRRFSEISAGPVGGAGVALAWSIRYFSRALGAGNRMSRLIVLPFFWIRYLDAFGRGRAAASSFSAAEPNGRWIRTPCRNTTTGKSEVSTSGAGPYERPLIFLHGVDEVDDIRATSVTERMEGFSLAVMKRSTPCG